MYCRKSPGSSFREISVAEAGLKPLFVIEAQRFFVCANKGGTTDNSFVLFDERSFLYSFLFKKLYVQLKRRSSYVNRKHVNADEI